MHRKRTKARNKGMGEERRQSRTDLVQRRDFVRCRTLAFVYPGMMTMKLFSCLALVAMTSCSLVTVPVKTAGGVAKTTVKTVGKVAEAPFKAAGGGYRD